MQSLGSSGQAFDTQAYDQQRFALDAQVDAA